MAYNLQITKSVFVAANLLSQSSAIMMQLSRFVKFLPENSSGEQKAAQWNSKPVGALISELHSQWVWLIQL